MTTLASEPILTKMSLSVWLWARLLADLRRRGDGRRESGAFLLGRGDGPRGRVTTYLCYDDLDPNALKTGAITFHAKGYTALWQACRERSLEVLADVHTHPGPCVEQSSIDRRHPMVPLVHHTALIVPRYGHASRWSLKGVGVYEYLGEFKWATHNCAGKPKRISLSLW